MWNLLRTFINWLRRKEVEVAHAGRTWSPGKISEEGIKFIAEFEGLVLKSYQDIGGIWTIGYGHTGPEVGPNQTITAEKALELLKEDVKVAEKAVRELVRVPTTDSQFDALCSFTFNLGAGRLKSSTLLQKLLSGNYEAAGQEFLKWDKVNGVPIPGLTRRRRAEMRLFLFGYKKKKEV